MAHWQVIIGPRGKGMTTKYDGPSLDKALDAFSECKEESRRTGVKVTVLKNGFPRWEYENGRVK